MFMSKKQIVRLTISAALVGSVMTVRADSGTDCIQREIFDGAFRYTKVVEFENRVSQQNFACGANCPLPATDVNVGRLNFGLTADGRDFDNGTALFNGQSSMVGVGTIHSNGRTCATCHRPDRRDTNGTVIEALHLGLPKATVANPLTNVIPLTDVLFTGREADDNGHPDAFNNLNNLGLVAIKPGRFNPLLAWNDEFRQVNFWRKVPRFVNTGLTHGFVNDLRTREVLETARGAIFSHTQNFNERFDDLLRVPNPRFPAGPPDFEERPRNIAAFIEMTTIDPPELAALINSADSNLNPQCSNAPGAKCKPSDCYRVVGRASCDLYTVLVNDPFFTVNMQTDAQRRGSRVFKENCMGCHSTPNVFGNADHLAGFPLNFSPRFGHAMDIGIAQRNKHNLDFRTFECTTPPTSPPTPCAQKALHRSVLALIKADGTKVQHTVMVDPGSAASTGRYEDLFRFKVPQLRRVSELGPYFHDNSADTLEEVVDYFNSAEYNNSADGRYNPIHLSPYERADLLAFLRVL